jgi:hypothetical protein
MIDLSVWVPDLEALPEQGFKIRPGIWRQGVNT